MRVERAVLTTPIRGLYREVLGEYFVALIKGSAGNPHTLHRHMVRFVNPLSVWLQEVEIIRNLKAHCGLV